MHRNKNKGFTLIELAIVLVVIGLIAGAIMSGKSLIKSAEIRRAITKMNDVKAAFSIFEWKYEALPGDMPNATDYWANTSNGNGDRTYRRAGSDNDSFVDDEGGYLWHHLGLAGVIGREFNRPNSSGITYTYNTMSPEIFPQTVIVGQNRIDKEHNRYGTRNNYLQVAQWSGIYVRCAAIDTFGARAIDKKIDDGVASSGDVMAYVASPALTCSGAAAGACTDHSGAGQDYQQAAGSVDYDLSVDNGKCRMAFIVQKDM